MIFPFSYAYLYSSAGVSLDVKITFFPSIPDFLERINSGKDEQSAPHPSWARIFKM